MDFEEFEPSPLLASASDIRKYLCASDITLLDTWFVWICLDHVGKNGARDHRHYVRLLVFVLHSGHGFRIVSIP